MRCFFACVWKDVRLFFSRKAAVLVLLLPILLLAVLIPGFSETTSARKFVKPFSFVVCDLDDSVMSRSLINQLRQFELFEDIAAVSEDDGPDKWFDGGYAAYVTIPEHFFYAMYDMENLPITVEFNPEMPAESSILGTVFTSVSDIVAAEQHARLAEYTLKNARGYDADKDEMYYESANYELKRALARRNIFSDYRLIEDYTENSIKASFATVTAILCMLIPLCVLRGLPEELSLGIVDRLKCSGKGLFMLILSKYIAALFLLLVPVAVLCVAVRLSLSSTSYSSVLMLFTFSFSLFGAICIGTPDASRAQLIGNMIIILSMLFGGALYPYQMLPNLAQKTALFSPVYYYLRGLNGSFSSVITLLSSAIAFSLLFLLYARNLHKTITFTAVIRSGVKRYDRTSSLKTGRPDLLCITWQKLIAMTGSRKMLIIMTAVSVLCFCTVDRILDEKSSAEITIAIADGDHSDISEKYVKALTDSEGVSAVYLNSSDAMAALDSGRAEAVLFIDKGFGNAFLSDEALPLRYYSSSAGVTSDAGREICAGVLLSMQSSYDAVSRLIASGVISDTEKDLFYDQLKAAESAARPIVVFNERGSASGNEKTVFGDTYARYSGFSALIIFLFMMSLSVLLSGLPSRTVKKSMSVVSRGYALFALTDHFALCSAGAIIAFVALICRPCESIIEILSYLLYVNCVSGICLLISLTRAGGGSDMTAVFFAMVTSAVGGCFFDMSSLGSFFSKLSFFTPQGLLTGAVSGSLKCLVAMLALSLACVALYYISGRSSKIKTASND